MATIVQKSNRNIVIDKGNGKEIILPSSVGVICKSNKITFIDSEFKKVEELTPDEITSVTDMNGTVTPGDPTDITPVQNALRENFFFREFEKTIAQLISEINDHLGGDGWQHDIDTQISGPEIIAAINAHLGGDSWQHDNDTQLTGPQIVSLINSHLGSQSWQHDNDTQLSGPEIIAAINAHLGGDGWQHDNDTQLSPSQIVQAINGHLGGNGWQQSQGVETHVRTFINYQFFFSQLEGILPAPGANKFYDIISIAISKNLTTGYNVNLGDGSFDFLLGNKLLGSFGGALQLETAGSRAAKINVPAYSGGSDVINQRFNIRGGSKTGGIGTIRIYVAYRIITV